MVLLNKDMIVGLSLIVFLALYSTVYYFKPNIIYNKGVLRDFGVGYKNKTVIPMWVATIILSILSYLTVISCFRYNKVQLY
jgi:hypothetical protein